MKKKETSTMAKVAQTVIFLTLSVISLVGVIKFWSFLFDTGFGEDRSRAKGELVLFIALIPAVFFCLAIMPWVKYKGVKGKVTGAQLMALDEDGCYLGPLKDFSLDDAKSLAHIFQRESYCGYENFHYSSYAIYIKNTKGGHWFFPDKIDKCLIMTGEPASVMGMSFRISEEECATIERILEGMNK